MIFLLSLGASWRNLGPVISQGFVQLYWFRQHLLLIVFNGRVDCSTATMGIICLYGRKFGSRPSGIQREGQLHWEARFVSDSPIQPLLVSCSCFSCQLGNYPANYSWEMQLGTVLRGSHAGQWATWIRTEEGFLLAKCFEVAFYSHSLTHQPYMPQVFNATARCSCIETATVFERDFVSHRGAESVKRRMRMGETEGKLSPPPRHIKVPFFRTYEKVMQKEH